jgi:spore germination cell wall hydrolase CwlJ-like protein
VLNRMRHPGYPASICGVVYQGADRTTGCQFTFTCDGSLLRTPLASLWARSRKIAEDALSGRVYAPIGHATHYHADYVLPYWADSLDTYSIGCAARWVIPGRFSNVMPVWSPRRRGRLQP